ncbi:hypothetical protein GF406_01785 [candidate division KSB1 bacterium]|nr:hypothetical protein [candidate division KSB1 bacterium]
MATPRQRLIEHAAGILSDHNQHYPPIEPGTVKMNELIEGAASDLGGDVLDYYMGANDRAYDRLETAIVREAT